MTEIIRGSFPATCEKNLYDGLQIFISGHTRLQSLLGFKNCIIFHRDKAFRNEVDLWSIIKPGCFDEPAGHVNIQKNYN